MDQRQYQQELQRAYESGVVKGRQDNSQNLDVGLQQTADQLRAQFTQQLNRTAGGLRKEIHAKNAHVDQKLTELAAIASSIDGSRSGGSGTAHGNRDEGNTVRPGMIRIEDIPGRRIPFTLLVDIAIGANTTSIREASVTISQEGPFVAVKRMAIFQSALEVQTTDPTSGALARFAGRSFGRYRPISSSYDLADSQHNGLSDNVAWYLAALASGAGVATALPSAGLALPTNMSSFRTMEFDGRIEVINAGSSYPRQNISVPSAFWSTAINAPWDLGALDFFERGEVLTVRAQPLHVNNPPAGNVDAECVIPNTQNGGTGWPFLEGQYDAHEGICTPGASTIGGEDPNLPNVLANDSVQRLPDGILTLGWEGYRIIQPIGPAI